MPEGEGSEQGEIGESLIIKDASRDGSEQEVAEGVRKRERGSQDPVELMHPTYSAIYNLFNKVNPYLKSNPLLELSNSRYTRARQERGWGCRVFCWWSLVRTLWLVDLKT